jgi:hypothetical protein
MAKVNDAVLQEQLEHTEKLEAIELRYSRSRSYSWRG